MAGPEEPPAPSLRAVGPPPEPSTMNVIISGRIARRDVQVLCDRARVLLEDSGADQMVCDVGALAAPDAVTVEALARLQLTAVRLGRRIRFKNACGGLQDLLALMGLSGVMACEGSPVEPRGQAKQREQASRVQEERDPGDPAS